VAEWAEVSRIIPAEAGGFPGPWRNDRAPYLVEIMDCLSPTHPCRRVTFRKSAQVGGTEVGTNWLGYIMDVCPGPTLVVHPTVDAAKGWGREKFTPSIDACPTLSEKVTETKSRDGSGSTGQFKRFPGGFTVLTGANSAAGLRQKSIRFLLKDDWDEWPEEVDGQGDPDKMANARLISFTAAGLDKTFQVSTPTIKGLSRVDNAFEASDQRYFHVPCPDCGHGQKLVWDRLRFRKDAPHNAEYCCEACGVLIPHHKKREMLAGGRWVAERPGPGRDPGFAISALYSPFTTWDIMVAEFVDAKNDPAKLKTWVNLWLGEAWEERGDAPDHEFLRRRAEQEGSPMGVVPAGAMVITCGVDVQKDYLVGEIVAWGVGKTSWSIDYFSLAGDTARPDVWRALESRLAAVYPDSLGNLMAIDMTAIDSGYNTTAVYDYCRRRPKVMAIKGMPGHLAPALGVPAKPDITFSGKRPRRRDLLVWPVGGWALKSEFYGNLRKKGLFDAAPVPFEIGYCHFTPQHGEEYFRQITAEHLVRREKNGRMHARWEAKGPNHLLDARIYAMAAAEHLGVSRWTPAQWAEVAAARAVPVDQIQADLLAWTQPVAPYRPGGLPDPGHDGDIDDVDEDGDDDPIRDDLPIAAATSVVPAPVAIAPTPHRPRFGLFGRRPPGQQGQAP